MLEPVPTFQHLTITTARAPTDPQQLAGEVLALRDVLRDRVGRLRANEWRYESGAGEQLRAEIALYERSLDRAGRLLADLARLNVDERLARISEQFGQLLADGLWWVFGELGLSEQQRALVPLVVPTMLEELKEGRVPRSGQRAAGRPAASLRALPGGGCRG